MDKRELRGPPSLGSVPSRQVVEPEATYMGAAMTGEEVVDLLEAMA